MGKTRRPIVAILSDLLGHIDEQHPKAIIVHLSALLGRTRRIRVQLSALTGLTNRHYREAHYGPI